MWGICDQARIKVLINSPWKIMCYPVYDDGIIEKALIVKPAQIIGSIAIKKRSIGIKSPELQEGSEYRFLRQKIVRQAGIIHIRLVIDGIDHLLGIIEGRVVQFVEPGQV